MNEAAEQAAPAIEVEDFVQRSAREAWDAFKTDPLLYIGATLLVTAVSVVSLGILAGPMIVGFIRLVQRRRRGQSAHIADVRAGLSQFASSFVTLLLIAVATAIGLGLLVVPGLFVLIATSFAFHELAYRTAHAVDALRASYHLAKRNLLHVLIVLVGVGGLNALGSAVLLGPLLTAPFAVLWMTVAYEILTGQTPARSEIAVAPGPAG